MKKYLYINNVPHEWKSLHFVSLDGNVGSSVIVAWPRGESYAAPIFLIDNNGTSPWSTYSYACWTPTPGAITFRDE